MSGESSEKVPRKFGESPHKVLSKSYFLYIFFGENMTFVEYIFFSEFVFLVNFFVCEYVFLV